MSLPLSVRLIKSRLCRYIFLGRSTILWYKEVITRDGCWEDWFRSSVLSLLILFSLLYRLHSKYQLYWHSYINFDRKVFIGEMFEYEFVSWERALFTLPVYYIKVYFKNSHKNIYSVRFIGAVYFRNLNLSRAFYCITVLFTTSIQIFFVSHR